MAVIPSVQGSLIGTFQSFPYWAVKVRGGMNGGGDRWLCELDTNLSPFNPLHRHFDWTLDVVTTGDILRVAELWMFCPPNGVSPKGNTATLRFSPDDAGTAFMFNASQKSPDGRIDHKIIGKVTDRESGDCICFIWDGELQVMSSPWKTNIYSFGTWRPGIPGKSSGVAPVALLSHAVLGLRL